MAEEHDYQRSGKKCKEKLDNLYKYYKKTKGMNKGKKDGRNYRFFKQLEVLYGVNNTNTTTHHAQENQEAIQTDPKLISSEANSDDEEGSESEEIYEERDWNLKIRNLIEMQTKQLMEMQESCHHGHPKNLAETLPHSYEEGAHEGICGGGPPWQLHPSKARSGA